MPDPQFNDPVFRSPLENRRLSRLPGQGLQERLFNDRLVPIAIWLGIVCGLTIGVLTDLIARWNRSESYGWHMLLMLSVGVAMAAWGIRRSIRLGRRESLGLEGEIGVAQTLEALKPLGYTVVHDLQLSGTDVERSDSSGANIDHVIVGPSGVYVIETKVRRKRSNHRGRAKVRFDGERVLIDGWAPDRDPIAQVRGAAARLGRFLEHRLGAQPPMRPVVLFPGWFVESVGDGRSSDVWVLADTAFVKWVENSHDRVSRLDDAKVALIAGQLADLSRWRGGVSG